MLFRSDAPQVREPAPEERIDSGSDAENPEEAHQLRKQRGGRKTKKKKRKRIFEYKNTINLQDIEEPRDASEVPGTVYALFEKRGRTRHMRQKKLEGSKRGFLFGFG